MNALWKPNHPELSRMAEFMRHINSVYSLTLNDYNMLYSWSLENLPSFWQEIVNFFQIKFSTPAQEILNDYDEMIQARWFSGSKFNFAEQLLSRRDDKVAIVALNENQDREAITYAELYQRVAYCAQGLKQSGVKAGDRVAGVMPNLPNTIIAMLATTSIGAIWSSCSPDFGAQAIIDRLGQIEPKVLFVCDGHQYQGKTHPFLDKITEIENAIPSLKEIVLCPTIFADLKSWPSSKLILWSDYLKPATDCNFEQLPFNHPIYILYSSGTTGKPKCIVHGAGGTLLQHLKELGLHSDIHSEDNLCFYSTCGWMMWNWMVSVLALGSTLTLYEGSPAYPDNASLFRVIEKEKVTHFGTSAKFIATLEKSGIIPKEHADLSSMRVLFSTGSPLLPRYFDYCYQSIKSDMQLSSMSGGTDIVSCFALGNPMLPVYKGELQCRGLGMAVEVLDDKGIPLEQERGELVCIKPFPSMPVGFWRDESNLAYYKAYFSRFPGIWAHGDYAELTAQKGLIIYGRSDAVLNPGGVRIGTAEIYRQVETIPEVVESIVVGQDWQDDVRVVLFVKLRENLQLDESLIQKIKYTLKVNASPRHVPAIILQVPDIPRTISGKIVELAVKQVIQGQEVNNIQSLANPEALNYYKNREELTK